MIQLDQKTKMTCEMSQLETSVWCSACNPKTEYKNSFSLQENGPNR